MHGCRPPRHYTETHVYFRGRVQSLRGYCPLWNTKRLAPSPHEIKIFSPIILIEFLSGQRKKKSNKQSSCLREDLISLFRVLCHQSVMHSPCRESSNCIIYITERKRPFYIFPLLHLFYCYVYHVTVEGGVNVEKRMLIDRT